MTDSVLGRTGITGCDSNERLDVAESMLGRTGITGCDSNERLDVAESMLGRTGITGCDSDERLATTDGRSGCCMLDVTAGTCPERFAPDTDGSACLLACA